MRLQSYINESLSDHQKNKLKKVLEDKCQPFLKEFGMRYVHFDFIYRGLKRRTVNTIDIIKTRTDRKPRIVNNKLHTRLNKIGKELFGWNIRSEGVFTGGTKVTAAYGNVCIFIPVGKYKYVYNPDISKIYALYDEYDNNEWYSDDYIPSDDKHSVEKWKDKRAKIEKKIYNIYKNDYKTSGLVNILNEFEFEAIFQCKEYLVVNTNYGIDLQDILREILGI